MRPLRGTEFSAFDPFDRCPRKLAELRAAWLSALHVHSRCKKADRGAGEAGSVSKRSRLPRDNVLRQQ